MTIPHFEDIFNQEGKPLYLALSDKIAECIRTGSLKRGQRLDPQRELAHYLGVTTGTVTRAYQELAERGLVSGEVGRGTFIREITEIHSRFNFSQELGAETIDMAYNLPPPLAPGLEADLYAQSFADLARDPSLLEAMNYHLPQVSPANRETGRGWLARCGVTANLSSIVLLAGSQHAIFVALLVLCEPGDEILVESLCYPGIKSAAAAQHLRVRGIAMDEQGILPDALDEACRGGAKVLYVVPTIHNPTIATMGTERRHEIARIAQTHGLQILEDDIHCLLADEHQQPIASIYPEGTWYFGNTSKCLSPGLRITYLKVPRESVTQTADLVQASVWMTPPLGAQILNQWVSSGVADRLLLERRAEAAARLELARDILGPLGARIPRGGYHVWMPLPQPWRADEFHLRTLSAGVALSPAEAFANGAGLPQAVRICLGGQDTREILERGLRTIEQIFLAGPSSGRVVM